MKKMLFIAIHPAPYIDIWIENIKQKLQLENLPIIFDKLADVDHEMLQKISDITKSQIFTTKVGEEEEITLL